jgi:hypothetical protein
LLERRLSSSWSDVDELDDLLRATPERLRKWLLARRRRLTATRWPALVDEESTVDVVSGRLEANFAIPGLSAQESREVLLVGLLRDLCASSLPEAGVRTGLSSTAVGRREALHSRLLRDDARYAAHVARVAVSALTRCHAT